MKRKIYAILMTLLLSTVTLAGCGDSGSSRSSRDRYEDDDDDDDRRSSRNDDDDDDRSSSKSSSSKKKDYVADIESLFELVEAFDEISYLNDLEEMSDIMSSAAKKFKPTTAEGKKIKSDAENISDIIEKMVRYQDDEDRLYDLMDDLNDAGDEFMEHVEDFIEAAEDAGVDDDDLEDLW